ncbi:type II toxin-antitoxin system PemK/MazF family toxin [Vreelandella salicampi]|uniref:Type II toxin-antitoxin system PemK/MazF family toxin n=1 Tax=Vreelandella salicampi TaxID=1449798 RepID=A0A7Z0RTZ6_9GAMM|nr:type II toxin-antitoxin system PemK/MazF family toxin [Halomonas salicampi]NYS59993.1 type II toxin-antitoxin system PemK/MazF family toxin [Halomonas salicampi]
MRRGDLVTVSLQGDFGKPRPALVIQLDQFSNTASITVLPLSSARVDAPLIRVDVEPTPENGLRRPSQVMVDKAMTLKRDKVNASFGRLEDEVMVSVNRLLALFLGCA